MMARPMMTTHTTHTTRTRANDDSPGSRIPRAVALLVTLIASLALSVTCSDDEAITEPTGGYLAFRDALLSGDPHQLWSWISEDTKQIYNDAILDIQALAESVRMLSPADRALAYERTAVRLAGHVETGEALFVEIVRLENLVGDQRYLLGTDIDDLDVADDGDHATVTTEAGQEFDLVRETDGVWRVESLSEFALQQVRPIAESVTAVDIIAAESAYMRRSHEEIVRLLGGTVESDDQE